MGSEPAPIPPYLPSTASSRASSSARASFLALPLPATARNEHAVEGALPHQPEVAVLRHPAGGVGPAVHHPFPPPVGTTPYPPDSSASPFPFLPDLRSTRSNSRGGCRSAIEGGNEGEGGGRGGIRVEPAEKGETRVPVPPPEGRGWSPFSASRSHRAFTCHKNPFSRNQPEMPGRLFPAQEGEQG